MYTFHGVPYTRRRRAHKRHFQSIYYSSSRQPICSFSGIESHQQTESMTLVANQCHAGQLKSIPPKTILLKLPNMYKIANKIPSTRYFVVVACYSESITDKKIESCMPHAHSFIITHTVKAMVFMCILSNILQSVYNHV